MKKENGFETEPEEEIMEIVPKKNYLKVFGAFLSLLLVFFLGYCSGNDCVSGADTQNLPGAIIFPITKIINQIGNVSREAMVNILGGNQNILEKPVEIINLNTNAIGGVNTSVPSKPKENKNEEKTVSVVLGDAVQSLSGSSTTIYNQSSSNDSSSPTPVVKPQTQTSPTSPPTQDINHILISEIFYDGLGSDTGKEFIELYNPSSLDINLTDSSLKNGTKSLAKIGSSSSDKVLIKAGKFFLIGLNGYNVSPSADVMRSSSLPNTSATISFYDKKGILIESVSYNNSVTEGQSYERDSLTTSSFHAQSSPTPKNSN